MRKKNVLLTIHDCRFMERKKGLAKKIMQWLYLEGPVSKAAQVTTVSEATKQDVLRYTGCDPKKITVIPVAINALFKPVPKGFNEACPVILQVGTGENKNIARLAEALQHISCKLVIIGQLRAADQEKLAQFNINYTVKTNLSTVQLYQEYIHCDMVSFISVFEGFGMPVIEAQNVERVVITSSISSLPEVAGNAACLVNPYDVEDIKRGLKKIISEDGYREELIVNGRRNRQRFTNETVAGAYYGLYKEMWLGLHGREITTPEQERYSGESS